MAVPTHDDVVVNLDAEAARYCDNAFGHLDVGVRGRRVASGMIVQQSSVLGHRIELTKLFGIGRSRWGRSVGAVLCDRA